MKAFILAAGLGTRLRPWTEKHPKALVPVGGIPMLERVIISLRAQGFHKMVINVHHFASQIIEFLDSKDFGVEIVISDESKELLDTGGAIMHAAPLLFKDPAPVLIHNVDILSNADLRSLMHAHGQADSLATLLVSDRPSFRRLICDSESRLCGWHNLRTNEFRPQCFTPADDMRQVAFSGIHVISEDIISSMSSMGYSGKFPIMDYYLVECKNGNIVCHEDPRLRLIDIGKPDTLTQAETLMGATHT